MYIVFILLTIKSNELTIDCVQVAVCICFTKLVFLRISQSSQENTCAGVSFEQSC